MNALTHSPITLSTAHLYPLQQVFDKVAKHLLTQNARSVRDMTLHEDDEGEAMCAYRGEDGLTCAVGCLISDEEYREFFEGMVSVYVVMELNQWSTPTEIPDSVIPHLELLRSLQSIHDASAPTLWPVRLRECADSFGLTFTP